jgi:hypothetical protein
MAAVEIGTPTQWGREAGSGMSRERMRKREQQFGVCN